MTKRVFNFSAGPAVLPVPALEEARDNLLSLGETGIGIVEHSHRGPAFLAVYEETVALCRELAGIPDDYDILFMHGGASTQFFMVPMNFLSPEATADYLVTGAWSKKALAEAKRFGGAQAASSSEDRNFCYIPDTVNFSDKPEYVHFTSNNTIYGTQYAQEPEIPDGAFLVCDASSDILSRPTDITKYGILYAGAQKNLGPSGVALVIIRKDLVERGHADLPTMLKYRTHAEKESAFNTPSTFGIYMICLVLRWLKQLGGLEVVQRQNQQKAAKLYDFLDQSSLFKPTADLGSRSLMNVTFVTGDAERDAEFIRTAAEAGFAGLKGHRSVGGMRASIYNAFPSEGVDGLVELMRQFEADHQS